MKRVVIAGGIGAGKTAATTYLSSVGWPIVDADVVARAVVEKGTPALGALVDAFGRSILTKDGDLDRAFMAEIVFHDSTALKRLNRITHGAIASEMARQVADTNSGLVFIAIPLFGAEQRTSLDVDEAWAIQVSPSTALSRLTGPRGLSEDDAKARIAAQVTNEERAALVDRVIWNEGTIEELHVALDEAVAELGVAHD